MNVQKGDRVRVASGHIGEVIEIWGKAHLFIRLKRDLDGRTIPMFESDIKEILQRVPEKKQGRRWGA
ncbi:MAG: hypothetical protein ACE3L7_04000 [Candidatus Pristimantibacillus sp.]